MQVDGEPWEQKPCTVILVLENINYYFFFSLNLLCRLRFLTRIKSKCLLDLHPNLGLFSAFKIAGQKKTLMMIKNKVLVVLIYSFTKVKTETKITVYWVWQNILTGIKVKKI